MSTATMTSKGQVTVPRDVRDSLGLVAGTRVTFTRNADGDYVLSTRRHSVRDVRGRLRYTGDPRTLEEMEAGVARGAAESMR